LEPTEHRFLGLFETHSQSLFEFPHLCQVVESDSPQGVGISVGKVVGVKQVLQLALHAELAGIIPFAELLSLEQRFFFFSPTHTQSFAVESSLYQLESSTQVADGVG
jgi:hypothetical protein